MIVSRPEGRDGAGEGGEPEDYIFHRPHDPELRTSRQPVRPPRRPRGCQRESRTIDLILGIAAVAAIVAVIVIVRRQTGKLAVRAEATPGRHGAAGLKIGS